MRYLILGCGWVGEYVALRLLKAGHEVWASTTTNQKYHRLTADGIFMFMQDFDQSADLPISLPTEFDYILLSIPATKKSTEAEIENRFLHTRNFVAKLQAKKHLFLSSIGIYPDASQLIFEDSFVDAELQPKLLLAEKIMLELPNSHVYRLGGLFGQQRIFAKYFQNRICETGGQPANFIHIEDVAGLIEAGFLQELQQQHYNVVCPEHPLKKAVILASAARYSFALPTAFIEKNEVVQKVVSSKRMQQALCYDFKFRSPLEF